MSQASIHCDACQRMTLHARPEGTSCGVLLLVLLLTGGLGLPIVLLVKANDESQPLRCQTCGRTGATSSLPMLLLVLFLLCGGFCVFSQMMRR